MSFMRKPYGVEVKHCHRDPFLILPSSFTHSLTHLLLPPKKVEYAETQKQDLLVPPVQEVIDGEKTKKMKRKKKRKKSRRRKKTLGMLGD